MEPRPKTRLRRVYKPTVAADGVRGAPLHLQAR